MIVETSSHLSETNTSKLDLSTIYTANLITTQTYLTVGSDKNLTETVISPSAEGKLL